MREIRFRVRDAKGRLIGFNRFEKGRWQCQMLKKAGGSEEWSNGVLHGQTMEQYTGVKDKNMQEIYEGDRVSWQEPNTEGRELGEVKWVNDGFSIEYEVVPGQFRILYFAPDIEVIGDIHENASPEGGK
jgi:hypothetical protein